MFAERGGTRLCFAGDAAGKGHFQPGVKQVPLESLYLQVSLPWKDWKVCHNGWRVEGGCRSWRVLFLGLLENSAAGRNLVKDS